LGVELGQAAPFQLRINHHHGWESYSSSGFEDLAAAVSEKTHTRS
jgi:hypothetical protein